MPAIEAPLEVLEAIDRILAYNWPDEERDWEEMEKPEEGHIYLDLRQVNDWLHSVHEISA